MKRFIIFILILHASLLHAGAVMRMYRVDLKNGQRIIFFAERHKGAISPTLGAEEVCLKQYKPFGQLFLKLAPIKNRIVLFIEYAIPIQQYYIKMQGQTGISNLTGCEQSYFDQFNLGIMSGRKEWSFVDGVYNFDPRDEAGWLLHYFSSMFDGYFEQYRKSGFNDQLWNDLKRQFFGYPEYKILAAGLPRFIEQVVPHVDSYIRRFKTILSPDDTKLLMDLIESRMSVYPSLQNVQQKASFLNKSFFEFLFDMAQLFKENFHKELCDLTYCTFPLKNIFFLTVIPALFTDLALLWTTLNDRHPIIMVSTGANHAELLFKAFFQHSQVTRSVRSLNMVDPEMMQNLDFASQKVEEFVLGD